MIKLISSLMALCLGITVFTNGTVIAPEKENSEIVVKSDEIIRISSEEELKDLLEKFKSSSQYRVKNGIVLETAVDLATVNLAPTAAADNGAISESSNYSETNIQVAGVDEADIIKTNGKFIYYLHNGVIDIIKPMPANKMELVKTIKLGDSNEYRWLTNEFYIDDNYITVVGNKLVELENEFDISKESFSREKIIYRPTTTMSAIRVFDIDSYKLVKEFEVSGNYVSSRKIGNNVYMISNQYIYNYDTDILPLYKDTVESKKYSKIAPTDIYYFKDFDECNYMITSSIDLDNLDEKANIQTFLGAGSEIYASENALYVTRVKYHYNYRTWEANDILKSKDDENKHETQIHKFDIKNGKLVHAASGSVPGGLLNQFSMDEYNGYFRITTTDNSDWEESTNNLYVLDKNLNTVGKIEGLAKGERIYSTRFMGDKCYIVTYKTVDPLFVIDLENPRAPKVLGELKIPGYSDYLHPLGDNYLIGFGKDSIEKSYINWDGTTRVTAYDTGMKLAIFDISDFNNPKEKYSVKIGGRGSYSELSYNHKSLLFDEERGIFAFPAVVYEETKFYENGTPMYGKIEFEGALVFDLSAEEGIKLRGKISNREDTTKINKYGDFNIQRILYIDDVLYTVSPTLIKSADINTVEEIGKLKLTTVEY